MNDLVLHPMKEIRIIIPGEHVKFATDLLEGIKATGYTIVSNISGKGTMGSIPPMRCSMTWRAWSW